MIDMLVRRRGLTAWAACVLLALPVLPDALAQSAGSGSSEQPAAAAANAPVSDPRIDTGTGRDKRVWPPDVLFEHKHMLLEVTIPDVATPKISGRVTVTLASIGVAQSRLVLDAGPGLTIESVLVGGTPAKFTHDKEAQKLDIDLLSPRLPGKDVQVQITYMGDKPGGRGAGLTFSADDDRTPEVDPMIHAQGQPQSNHLWFPCHDFPNLRLSTEVKATVPEAFEAVSNGRLVSVTRTSIVGADGQKFAARTFHWKQDKPHAYYLVTLCVGRFDVVNVGGPKSDRPGLWMPVYGPLGSGEALRRGFGNTPAMVANFEEVFATPFPWDKYAQIMCRDFAAGAMENTSATTFSSALARAGGRRGSIDDIIAHELCHQWFGDLITCRSWEHLWLNEGWATFGEALWAEKVKGRAGYEAAIARNFASERLSSASRRAPRNPPMVSNRYTKPDARFTSPDNVYQKGGAVLHMLRERLGDEVFFKGVRLYLKRNAFGHVETDDFRFALEEASGQSLERFFDQWCLRPGHPALQVDIEWKADGDDKGPGTLKLRVEQTQRIDADNPSYAFSLPVYVELDGEKSGRWVQVVCDSASSTASVKLPSEPTDVQVDPNMTVLSRMKVKQPTEHSLKQVEPGHTMFTRLGAIDRLMESQDPRAARALAKLAMNVSTDGYVDDPDSALAERARGAVLAMLDRKVRETVAVMTPRMEQIAVSKLVMQERP